MRHPASSPFVINAERKQNNWHKWYDNKARERATKRIPGGCAHHWRIAEPKDIEDSGSYYLEFSYKLDVSQLPRPMQIGLQSGFALSIEQKRNFNPDFSLKTQ